MEIINKIVLEDEGIIIEAAIIEVGIDRLIIVSGGEVPHIGAISFGNQDELKEIALKTHKELIVTKEFFERLKHYCKGNLLVTGGIHIDNITPRQIKKVMEINSSIIEKIKDFFVSL